MKQFFVLVAADEDKSRLSLPSAYDRALYRLKNRRWGLNVRTRNPKSITTGDEVVIYAAGNRRNGMTFVGRATVARKPGPLTHEDRRSLDSPAQRELTICVEAITLCNIEIFDAPLPARAMATSSPEDAPRGMEFLYNLNRFNVASSRARCACIVVGNPQLFSPECRTPRQMELANVLCRYAEMSTPVRI